MDYFSTSFDPIISVGSNIAKTKALSGRVKKEVVNEFAQVFYAELLKQSFNNGSGIFSSNENRGFLPSLGSYRDIFYDKVVKEMISKGRFDNIMAREILPSVEMR